MLMPMLLLLLLLLLMLMMMLLCLCHAARTTALLCSAPCGDGGALTSLEGQPLVAGPSLVPL
jgi:hypothetical protein